MHGVIDLDRAPRVVYQRAALDRWQTGRASAGVCEGDAERMVRVEARFPRPVGAYGRAMRRLWQVCAFGLWRRASGDGRATQRVVFYADARDTAAGDGVGLVRCTGRARPVDATTTAHRGHDPAWVVVDKIGRALLVLDGVDDPAPWDAREALSRAA